MEAFSEQTAPKAGGAAARRVISNFHAWVQGTSHGLSRVRLQAYTTELGWHYSQMASGGISMDLLCNCPLRHAVIDELLGSFAPQSSGGTVRAGGGSEGEQRGRVRMLVEMARAREVVAWPQAMQGIEPYQSFRQTTKSK